MDITDLMRGMYVFEGRVPSAGFRLHGSATPWHRLPREASETGQLPSASGLWLTEDYGESRDRWGYRKGPLKDEGLHTRFAALNVGDDLFPERALSFANRYGLLGIDLRFASKEDADGHGHVVTDTLLEPLQVWRDEVHRLALLMALWKFVREEDARSLRRCVFWAKDGSGVALQYIYTFGLPTRIILPEHYTRIEPGRPCNFWYGDLQVGFVHDWVALATTSPDVLAALPRDSAIPVARAFISRQINERLRGHVHPTLLVPNGTFCFQPDSLLAAIYVSFAMEVAGQARPMVCPQCGEVFYPKAVKKISGQTCGTSTCRNRKRRGSKAA